MLPFGVLLMDCKDLYYSYKNENKQIVVVKDGTEFQYGSTLNSFKSSKNNSYVVVWKIEHENHPTFNAYYVNNGKVMKIGEWGIFTLCETCDAQDYSIEDIRIFQRDDKIEFSFLKDVEYMDYSKGYNNDWASYKAGTLTLSFNIIEE